MRARRPSAKRSVAAWSCSSPLVLLALAVLIPALHFFEIKTRLPSGCLVANTDGYGSTCIGPAHRVAVMFASGAVVPDDKLVCHRCDHKPCVEPSHLYVGTFADNNRDTRERVVAKKGRSNLPHFTTWREWCDGGWRATDVPLVRDTEGVPEEVDLVEMTSAELFDVDCAQPVMGVEDGSMIFNPDLWSEDDERSLMVLGCLDGREPSGTVRKTYGKWLLGKNASWRIRRWA